MCHILPGIESLVQHLSMVHEKPERYHSKYCPHCGKAGVWCHGHYDRKADRENTEAESLNSIPIPRFFCKNCKKTHSVLPECIPPQRWYLWHIQQTVILLLCAGLGFKSISQQVMLARSTCRRWWHQLQEQFMLHRDALSIHIHQLGSFCTVIPFWSNCLQQISFARAMYFCHLSGVAIP